MLDGITVLSETVHQVTISDEIGLIFVSLLIAFFVAMFAAVNIDDGYIALGTGVIMFIILVFLFNIAADKYVYSTYKVTISEDVKFIEFTEKYEILSQEGQIYEIREKETE